MKTQVDEATPTAIVSIDLDPILNPTPQSLRQAIIMSEVLGPPIALRSAGANLWDA